MSAYQKLDTGIFLGSSIMTSIILYTEYSFITSNYKWQFCNKNIPDPECSKIYVDIFYAFAKSAFLSFSGSYLGVKLSRKMNIELSSSDFYIGALLGYLATNGIFLTADFYRRYKQKC